MKASYEEPLINSSRLGISVLLFLSGAILFSHRADLSLGIVCMVNHTYADLVNVKQQNIRKECVSQKEDTHLLEGEFEWPRQIQGYILGSFFYGYLTTQVLGGYLCERFGSKLFLLVSVLISSIFTLLIPILSNWHWIGLLVARVLVGMGQGFFMPAVQECIIQWFPIHERGLLNGISHSGFQLGTIFSIFISAPLCQYGPLGGWPSIFYIFGTLGILFIPLWVIFGASSPKTSKRITSIERLYIENSNKAIIEDTTVLTIPWKAMLTSQDFWIILLGHFTSTFGNFFITAVAPLMIKNLFGISISNLGYISALPFIALFFSIQLAGAAIDFIIRKKMLSVHDCRRLFMFVGITGQSILFLLSAFLTCHQSNLAILLIVLAVAVSGLNLVTVPLTYLEVAGNHASIATGFGNMGASVAGLAGPLLYSLLTPNNTQQEWRLLFIVIFAILNIGSFTFVLFYDGRLAKWARKH
uniref:MFS domain-containing protein n=1 Tax=Rhabditophanes sp. KR3021 TaxID=114890 RepID=A0AC35U9P3_9BILA